MASRLACAAKTDVGLKRTNNEDNFAIVQRAGLYVLADGMGGHASGQVASTMCVSHVAQFICEMSRQPGFKLMFPPKPELSYEANLLVNAIKYANERVFIQSCKDRSMEGMGTTVTAIFNAPHGLVLAHVGDSRIYRVRNGEITQMSRDHSLLNHLIDKGELKPEDADNFASKNVILRAIGLKDEVEVEVKEVPRETGDIYMMCSDGLSDLVSDQMICRTIAEAGNLDDACSALIGLALKAGGKDNVTVVCVSIEDAGTASQPVQAVNRGMSSLQMPSQTAMNPVGMQQPGMHPTMGNMRAVQMHNMSSQGVQPMNMSQPNMPPAGPNMSHPGMPAMSMGRQVIAAQMPGQPVMSAAVSPIPQRMHSVREIVESRPAQRAMPKPIGSAGRSKSISMQAIPPASDTPQPKPETKTQSGKVKIHAADNSSKASPDMTMPLKMPNFSQSASDDGPDMTMPLKMPNFSQSATNESPTAKSPKEIKTSTGEDKANLPETHLLFTAPPTAAGEEPEKQTYPSIQPIQKETPPTPEVEPALEQPSDDDDDDDSIRTVIECPIITDEVLNHVLHDAPRSSSPVKSDTHNAVKKPSSSLSGSRIAIEPPQNTNAGSNIFAPIAKSQSQIQPAKPVIQPSPSLAPSHEIDDDDDDDSIVISRPNLKGYNPPQEAIKPPQMEDGDSIEISSDLYQDDEDDEDSVTRTFKPTIRKW